MWCHMSVSSVDEAIALLEQRKRSMRCSELVSVLQGLGFEVRSGRLGGHKIYTHAHLQDFTSDGINCEHGRNPQVKPAYVGKVIRNLRQHRTELEKFLGAKHD